MPRFICPYCQTSFELPAEWEGRKARCSSCNEKSRIAFLLPPAAPTIILPSEDVSPVQIASFDDVTSWPIPAADTSKRRKTKSLAFLTPLFLICCVVVFVGAFWLTYNRTAMPRKSEEIVPPDSAHEIRPRKDPTNNEIYTRSCELVLVCLKQPKKAKLSEHGNVRRLSGEKAVWRVSGDLSAPNNFGEIINGTWQVDLEWSEQHNQLMPQVIFLGNEIAYQSPEVEAAMKKLAYAFGNGYSGLPEDIAKEIRNVQAAVDDAIKKHARLTYSPQWPDDPARREFKVHINQDDFWEINGKIETFDGAPRQELFAIATRRANIVTQLRIGKRILIRDGATNRTSD